MTTPTSKSVQRTDGNTVSPLIFEMINEFNDVFDSDFFLWKEETNWECIAGTGYEDQFDFLGQHRDRFVAILEAAHIEQSIKIHTLYGKTYLFVPCKQFSKKRGKKSSLVSVGHIRNGDISNIKQIALLTYKLFEERQKTVQLTELNERYANQVSHDFEELHWLRNLAGQMEYCEADSQMADVARKVLPNLCDLIKAKSLIFFPNPNQNTLSLSEPFVTGDTSVDMNQCQEIIDAFQEEASVQPVVHNYDFKNQNLNTKNYQAAFALVPVNKGSFKVGWILAFNRKADAQISMEGESHSISESSFGTFEVGLMAAAGILLANHARNANLYQEQEELLIGVIRSLINSIDAKDPYTCGHSDRVALMAKRLAKQLRMSEEECERIYMTGLLHDVGKIGVPDEVLCKKGKLTDEEYDLIKLHPEIGYTILQHLKPLKHVLPGVMHHHESYDGNGYPHQLAGNDIPLEGRILAVVDAYDAMTSSRPYRSAMPFEKAESILVENSGTQWDPKIVKAFFAAIKDMHKICEKTEEETKDLFDSQMIEALPEHKDSISSAVVKTHT